MYIISRIIQLYFNQLHKKKYIIPPWLAGEKAVPLPTHLHEPIQETKIMTRKYFFIPILLVLTALNLTAATPSAKDTLTVSTYRACEAFAHNFSYMGLPFILAGVVVKEHNTHFRTLRNRFEPAFHKRYDDYTQYVPLAAT